MNYRYDDSGNRIVKDVGSTAEYYFRDHTGKEVAIYDLNTDKIKMINLFGIGQIGNVIAVYDENGDQNYINLLGADVFGKYASGEGYSYYIKDHLGSTRVVVDETGTVMEAYEYYPFSRISRSYINGTGADEKFTGKELDNDNDERMYYFGARYYDSKIGRWLSVDPLASKYPGWSRYNYVANNPLVNYDPDGRKIFHHSKNSNSFRKDFANAIKYLNKHGAISVIKDLNDRNEIVTLKEGKWKYDTYYDHKTKTLFWNPNYAFETTEGGKQTPALGLVHEAGHAVGHLENKDEYLKNLRTEDIQYDNKEEKRVIDDIENPAAVKLGEPTSSDHKSKPYRVNGPTSTKKVKDPIYEEDN